MSETKPESTAAAAKKAPVTRVYPVTDRDGRVRNVEAASSASAIIHVYKPHVGRPLGGGEVNALHRAGVMIEVAGEAPSVAEGPQS